MRAVGSRATALATLVLVTRPRTSCQRASRRLPRKTRCGRLLASKADRARLGAGFDRRRLVLREVHARRLRPAGRLTCTCPRETTAARDCGAPPTPCCGFSSPCGMPPVAAVGLYTFSTRGNRGPEAMQRLHKRHQLSCFIDAYSSAAYFRAFPFFREAIQAV